MIKAFPVLSILPTTGKFYFSKFQDSSCSIAKNVDLVNPTGACWSTNYDNGIKPVAYDEALLKLSIQVFDTSSCYGTTYKTADVKCDDSQCVKNPLKTDEFFKCTYLQYPPKANFTLTKYYDHECLYQNGIVVLKGDSKCWGLPDKGSISPVKLVDIKTLSFYYYGNNKECTGTISDLRTINCDNTCFKSPNEENQYFRCNYLIGNYLKLQKKFIIILLGLLL